ncbi:hypothetical protein ABZ172_11390 [Streptomyces sp. NPDC006296]|uniref:hypothetical protein n=1 Tax=Streptomyces sp. NPDC006296 TaxID=3156746 RepID=UPI0033B6AEAC
MNTGGKEYGGGDQMSRTENRKELLQTMRGKTRRLALVSTWIDLEKAADHRFLCSLGVSDDHFSFYVRWCRMMTVPYASARPGRPGCAER